MQGTPASDASGSNCSTGLRIQVAGAGTGRSTSAIGCLLIEFLTRELVSQSSRDGTTGAVYIPHVKLAVNCRQVSWQDCWPCFRGYVLHERVPMSSSTTPYHGVLSVQGGKAVQDFLVRRSSGECVCASPEAAMMSHPTIRDTFSAGGRAILDFAAESTCSCLLGRDGAKDGCIARTTCKQASTWLPSCRSITYPEVRGRRTRKTSLRSMRQMILRGRNIVVADTPTFGSTCSLQR